MHVGALRKWALALTLWLALYTSSLKAQIFTNDLPLQAVTTGTNPVDFEFRADGTLISKGNFGVGSLLLGDQGVGTRMLWFPKLGAFRAGGASSYYVPNAWDLANIGIYSAAFNYDTIASGSYSFASGRGSTASGYLSTALGDYTTASDYASTAMGATTQASGIASTSMGIGTVASGIASTAFGITSTASGYGSIATGYATTASGYYSSASGRYTQASALDSFVVGTWNVGGGTSDSWVATDPLFEIGNGTPGHPHDALLVDKSGNVTAKTFTTTAPAGDIPMYTGN